MVQKQHSKTSRLFALTKQKVGSEPPEGSIIQRISAPLSRFHTSKTHADKFETEANSEAQDSPRGSYKRESPSTQRKKKSNKYKPDIAPSLIQGLTDSSIDSSLDTMDRNSKQEMSETSEISVSESTQGKEMPKIKHLFRRSLLLPTKEDSPRFSTPEKNIENGRKSYLRGLNVIAKRTLEEEIKCLQEQLGSQENHPRLNFILAAAYYYMACVEFAEKEFNSADICARESLGLLDDILLSCADEESLLSQEKKKALMQESWLHSHWEINVDVLWTRKSMVENLLGSIILEKRDRESSLEWLQRSIYIRETRIGLQGLPGSYVSIAFILVENIKEQFKSHQELLSLSLAFRFEVFFELFNLLSLAKSRNL